MLRVGGPVGLLNFIPGHKRSVAILTGGVVLLLLGGGGLASLDVVRVLSDLG